MTVEKCNEHEAAIAALNRGFEWIEKDFSKDQEIAVFAERLRVYASWIDTLAYRQGKTDFGSSICADELLHLARENQCE